MKTELTIISDDLNHGIIDEKKVRTLLLDLLDVSKSFTAEEVVNELEDCDTLDDAIMFFKEQMFNKAEMMIEEQTPNNSTETAILPMHCCVPFFVKDIDGIRHLFPWQSRQPQWLKEYLLLIKTRRGNKHYVVKGLSFGANFSVKGFSKFKVIGWRELP